MDAPLSPLSSRPERSVVEGSAVSPHQLPTWTEASPCVFVRANLMLIVRLVVMGDAAGFKAHDSPLAHAIAIDPGVAEPSANIAIAIFSHQFGLRRNYGSVP